MKHKVTHRKIDYDTKKKKWYIEKDGEKTYYNSREDMPESAQKYVEAIEKRNGKMALPLKGDSLEKCVDKEELIKAKEHKGPIVQEDFSDPAVKERILKKKKKKKRS